MSLEAPLFSDQWHRIAGLRPELAPQLCLARQRVRGESWWILASEDGRRSHRLDASAYALVGRCNGQRTMQQIWDLLNHRLGDTAPTQDDAIQMLSRLHAEGWLRFDTTPDFASLLDERRRRARTRRKFNPLALRIPLGDPQRLLARLDPLAQRLVSKPALWLWCALMVLGSIAAGHQFDALVDHGRKWMATPRYIAITWCLYPLIKLLHELAHGLAVRRWGGQVRQAGVTLLMFTPVPFVDASAANLFPRATQRAVVSMAGVMAELTIATVGLALWMLLGPGLLRDMAFISIVIGCVSTLAVNANPLLRFDGYFAACDLLGLPNLALRSRTWWTERLCERLLGVPLPQALRLAPGERPWLFVYAPLSWCYQLALALLIAGWVAGFAPAAGLAVGVGFGVLLVGRPAWGLWRAVSGSLAAVSARGTAMSRTAIAMTVLLALVALVPVPDRTVAQGVVWLPERAMVRAAEDGFVDDFLVRDGMRVEAGQLLARMNNPAFSAEHERLQARREGLRAQQYAAMREDPAVAEQLREAVDLVDAELASASARLAALELRASANGRLVMPRQHDVAGAFARRGRLLAYVLDDDAALVRVAVPQARAEMIRVAPARVEVRLAQTRGTVHLGSLGRDTLAADQQLPSAALSVAHGGRFVTDPADAENRRTITPVVTVDVRLVDAPKVWLGERAWVRFEHGYRPMLFRWARNIQQSLLQSAQAAAA